MKLLLLFTVQFFICISIAQSQRIDSLLQVLARSSNDVEELKALNAISAEYVRTDVPRAKSYMFLLIERSRKLGNARYLSAGYAQLVTLYHNAGNKDSALQMLGVLSNLSKYTTGNDKKIIDANYNATAGLYYKRIGNQKEAIKFLKRSLALMEADGVKQNIAGQHLNLGNTYNLTGDYKNALLHHLKALKLFEEEQNLKGQSFCYQSISSSFTEMRQYKNALRYAMKSLEMKTALNDNRGVGTAEMGLGQIYHGLGQYDLAMNHYQNAATVATNLKLVPEQLKINFHMAKTLLEKKDTVKATRFFNASQLMALQIGDSSMVSSIQLELAALQTKKQPTPLSEQALLKSMAQVQQSGQVPREASGYMRLAEMFASNQQYEKALEYTKKSYEFRDSITNTELQAQIKRIEEQYRVGQKEKEITLLKKDQLLNQAVIEKQKVFQAAGVVLLVLLVCIALLAINRYKVVHNSRQLLEIEKMRNGIARDLHDDIGSTLTSINILSKVMLQQQSPDRSMHANLSKIKEHSATIMESMSDIVWAINPHNDTVEKVIYKMKEFTAEVFEPLNIKYSFQVEGDFSAVKLTLAKRKDLYLIFKEAINNAAKYSKCDVVNIILKHADASIQLHVNDNGDGFDEQTVKAGNGLRNMRERAKNMLASLSYRSDVGLGTDLKLSVPLT